MVNDKNNRELYETTDKQAVNLLEQLKLMKQQISFIEEMLPVIKRIAGETAKHCGQDFDKFSISQDGAMHIMRYNVEYVEVPFEYSRENHYQDILWLKGDYNGTPETEKNISCDLYRVRPHRSVAIYDQENKSWEPAAQNKIPLYIENQYLDISKQKFKFNQIFISYHKTFAESDSEVENIVFNKYRPLIALAQNSIANFTPNWYLNSKGERILHLEPELVSGTLIGWDGEQFTLEQSITCGKVVDEGDPEKECAFSEYHHEVSKIRQEDATSFMFRLDEVFDPDIIDEDSDTNCVLPLSASTFVEFPDLNVMEKYYIHAEDLNHQLTEDEAAALQKAMDGIPLLFSEALA